MPPPGTVQLDTLGEVLKDTLDTFFGDTTWRTQLTGAQVQTALDTLFGDTVWRTHASGTQVQTTLDALFGNTGWRTVIDKATAANVRAGTADKYLAADIIGTSAAFVTLTDAASIAVDLATFINGTVTLTANRAIANPTNGTPGVWRSLHVIQDATGSRTLSWGNQYRFAGGTTPVLTTTANARDTFSIHCVTATEFDVFPGLNMKAA